MYIYGECRPTGRMRWVERFKQIGPDHHIGNLIQVLQQEMIVQGDKEVIEWRDVPVEKE